MRPKIQEHHAFTYSRNEHISVEVPLGGRDVGVIYFTDTLKMVALDLCARLQDSLGIGSAGPGLAPCSFYLGGYDYIIALDLWDMQCNALKFMNIEFADFQQPPEGDEYYIMADEQAALITASTYRGAWYGATTLWQAIYQSGGQPYLSTAVVRDFPVFENRLVYLGFPLGKYAWPFGTYTPEVSEGLLADSIMVLGREFLIRNKGTGVVHGGRTYQYDTPTADTSQNTQQRSVTVVLDNLQQGMQFPHSYLPLDWGHLGLEWHEGIGWERVFRDPGYNTNYCFRAVQIAAKCVQGDTASGRTRLVVRGDPLALFENGDFEGTWNANSPEEWDRVENVTHGTEGANDFVRLQATGSSGAFIEQWLMFQEHYGPLSRQMLLTFRVRATAEADDSVRVYVRALMQDCADPTDPGTCTNAQREFSEPNDPCPRPPFAPPAVAGGDPRTDCGRVTNPARRRRTTDA